MGSQQNVQGCQHMLTPCIWGHEIAHTPMGPSLGEVMGCHGDNACAVKIMSHDGKHDCHKESAG